MPAQPSADFEDEISSLIATLHETERRLEELTGGEVDTVSIGSGQPFLLRRAQKEMREREAAKQAAILNALPAQIALLDPHGRIVSVNETWLQSSTANFLQGPGIGVGLNYFEVCDQAQGDDASDARRVATGIHSVLSGAKTFSLEYTCNERTGWRCFNLTVTPLTEDLSRGAIVMHVDITERRVAEIAVRDSQATMAAAQRISHFGSWELQLTGAEDVDAGTLIWSDEMFRIAGYEPGAVAVSNRFFFSLVPAEEHMPVRQAVANALQQRHAYSIVHRLIRPDGEVRFVQENAQIFSEPATGRPQKIVGTAHDITDRKRSEAALAALLQTTERRERMLTKMLSHISDFTYIYDRQGRFLFANQPLLELWGLTLDEVAGKTFFDLGYPKDLAQQLHQEVQEVFESGTKVAGETPYTSPSGASGFYEYIFSPAFASDGSVEFVVGSTRDITERRRATELLMESRERLTLAVESAQMGIWEWDVVTNHLVWDAQMYAIYGLREQDFTGAYGAWQRGLHPEDRRRCETEIFAAVEHGNGFHAEFRILRPSGEVRMIEAHAVMHRSGDGTSTRMIGVNWDITERKRIAIELQASETRFKALFDQAAVGVMLTDVRTGRFVQVNLRFCGITGRSRENLEELTVAEITHPQDRGLDLEKMRQLRSGDIREAAWDKRYVRPDGTEVWVSLTVSAMWAPGAAPDYCVAVALDITERKRIAEQLRQAQKMEAIGTLAGGIAHDFNNVLAAINGYAELSLLLLKGHSEVREHLGSVLNASRRAADLVRQILAFSRHERPERQLIQLRPVVEETFKLLRATIPSTIEFALDLASDTPAVLADATQIHQILMNLGTNAWHAMRDQTGRLQVKLEAIVIDGAYAATQTQLKPGLFARISVSDTGCGMDQATLRRIFEPFFTTKPVGHGTGLGLAVVHGIMASHDGAVTVYSEQGKGTVFSLYFPAHAGEVTAVVDDTGPAPRGHGEQILFIDDEALLAKLGQKTLTALGYTVEVAQDPAVGLELVRAAPSRFALVITDQTMPGMTGSALANEIRRIRPGLPVILMTGYGLALTPERVREAGIHQLLFKPTTIHTLGTAVHAALSDKPLS